MTDKLDAMTDQQLADAVQEATERAIRLATAAVRRACKDAANAPCVVGPVVAGAAQGLGCLWQAHGHFTNAALALPSVQPSFGGK